MDAVLRKKSIRKQHLEQRALMSEHDYRMRSNAICTHLMEMADRSKARRVHAFLPIVSRFEPNIIPALEHFISSGITVVVPIADAATRHMQHTLLTHDVEYEVGAWGEPIPKKVELVNVEHYDLIIVPMLSVDSKGYRLGYGKGYYDQFLTEVSGTTVGICYDNERLEEVPIEKHDRPVTYVITEKQVFQTGVIL
jgi:5-formyltetrahydrofolate cyclo-ligase